jgi:hypothetical protein
VSHLKTSHSFVEEWMFGYIDGTDVIAHKGNSLKDLSKISHYVHNPQDLGAAATYSTFVVDCITENCFREDRQTREDLRK